MAALLSTYFGTSDGYWINLLAHHDPEIARDKVDTLATSVTFR
jgi:plasmid maintenance system antidote protein VapI